MKLRWPGEWAPRDGTLLAWPPAAGPSWRGVNPLLALFDALIEQLRAVEPVYLIVHLSRHRLSKPAWVAAMKACTCCQFR